MWCTDRALLALLTVLVAQATDQVAAIALGDHAPSSLRVVESRAEFDSIPHGVLRACFDVGNNFLLPASVREGFVPPASSVNVFPAILNAVISAQIPMKSDAMHYARARPAPIYLVSRSRAIGMHRIDALPVKRWLGNRTPTDVMTPTRRTDVDELSAGRPYSEPAK